MRTNFGKQMNNFQQMISWMSTTIEGCVLVYFMLLFVSFWYNTIYTSKYYKERESKINIIIATELTITFLHT